MAGQGTGVEVGTIARAGAGIQAPTQGSTVGDMADTMGKVLAGMEARRQANEAKALEEAKLAVARQQADAQTMQAENYGRQVDVMAEGVDLQRETFAHEQALAVTAEERAEESHNMGMSERQVELAEYRAMVQSRVANAPVNRTILRDAALASPDQVPWRASDVDRMDDIQLADNARWWRDQLNARTNQLGAAGGAIMQGVNAVYQNAVTRAQNAAQNLRQAQADLAARKQEALATPFFQETEGGVRVLLDLAPADQREAIAALNSSVQAAQEQVRLATEQYGQAQGVADSTQGVMLESIQQIEGALGMQVSERIRGALGASADSILGAQEGADSGQGASAGAQSPAGPSPSAVWVTGPEGQVIPAPPPAVMEGLSRAFMLDPHVYEQQVNALRGRYPGVDVGMQQMHGVDSEGIQARKVAAQRLALQEAQDRAYRLDGQAGRSEDALAGITYLIRSGREDALLDNPEASLEIGDMVRRLTESGMTRDAFAASMRERSPRTRLQQSFVYDFVYNRLPNRVGGN